MAMKVYNTLSRKKEKFVPEIDGKIRMYVCGPTVYGLIHIGNARTFTTFDLVRRYFEYKGYKVDYVQNITDVGHLTDVGEDKIMRGAAERGMNPWDFVELNIKEYFKDLDLLNIKRPTHSPRATECIQDMIDVVKKLIEKGYAYQINGSVYFDTSKFRDYGKLSKMSKEELAKLKIEPNPKKRNPSDFALWIAAPEDYPMKWESPWGIGFPGWHIECSTMASKFLGLPLDIHGGGKDLIFPHHENEIAQAEAATGKKFVNYWMHGEFILIDGKKMSKSLGNIITARDAARKYGPMVLRFFFISSHYRSEINFTESALQNAKRELDKLKIFMQKLKFVKEQDGEQIDHLISDIKEKFEEAMDDDFNTPAALTHLFEFIKTINSLIAEKKISKRDANKVYNLFLNFDKVLGLKLGEERELPDELKELIERRNKLRREKKWAEADKIRAELRKKGVILEDLNGETIWRWEDGS